MNDQHEDLIQRLEVPSLTIAILHLDMKEAATTIKALVEERDTATCLLAQARSEADGQRSRAERAEADLSAARAALRYADEEKGISWIPEHATAIAAARADGGE